MRSIHRVLPPQDRILAAWLIEILILTAKEQKTNQMTPENLGIVFGPGVFGCPADEITMSPLQMMQSVEDCKLGKELIAEIVRYYLENPDQRPLLDKSLNQKENSIPSSAGVRVTFRQSSSLGLLLASRRTVVERDTLTEEERLKNIDTPSSAFGPKKKKKAKKDEKTSNRLSGPAFQKELQLQFVNGKATTLRPSKPKKTKKTPFSTIRAMIKTSKDDSKDSKDAKDTKETRSTPATPKSSTIHQKGRNRKTSKGRKSQPLPNSLRRSDSSLDKLVETLDKEIATGKPGFLTASKSGRRRSFDLGPTSPRIGSVRELQNIKHADQ